MTLVRGRQVRTVNEHPSTSSKGEPATDILCGGLALMFLIFIKSLVEGYIRCLLRCLFSGTQTLRELCEGCILRTGNLQQQAHQLRTLTANTRQ